MRKTVFFSLLFLSALALGQGRQTPADLHKQGTAGPGYIQSTFVDALTAGMKRKIGARRTARMLEVLRGDKDIEAKDVLKIMNGRVSKRELRKRFGATKVELDPLREALGDAVFDKERRMFFGILVNTMVTEEKVDPSSEYCKLVGATCNEIEDADFEKLKSGNRSTSLIKAIFGFKKKDDGKAMQRYLNKASSSPLMDHPMMESYTQKRGNFDKSQFPELKAGMPGTGKEYGDGLAGGLPFDVEMPPCPFYGKNLETFFKDK